MKNKYLPLIAGILALAIYSCSRKPQKPGVFIQGRITVNPKVDTTKDYSGIGVTVIQRDTSGNADTLFHAVTDKEGDFEGKATFKKTNIYPLYISRNGDVISRSSIILANKDSIKVTGQIPDFNQTAKISSKQNTAFRVYRRVERNYNNIVKYVNSGALPQDTIPGLVKTWSNLFWSIRKSYPHTIAANRSTINAFQLLSGIYDKELLQKYDSLNVDDTLRNELAEMATDAAARTYGLNGALHYIDSLKQNAKEPRYKMILSKNSIKLLYDSSRVKQARTGLTKFKKNYDSEFKDAKEWVKGFQYNLDHLAPGMTMPAFKIVTTSGDTISNKTLKGKPYLLEITGLANKLYQSQFPRMQAIYLIYKRFGLQYVTVPIDQSQVTINAFFKQRGKDWPVAKAGAYKKSNMLKRFNVQYIPTRFLVNSDGKIIRKYVGTDINRFISDLKLAFKKNKKP